MRLFPSVLQVRKLVLREVKLHDSRVQPNTGTSVTWGSVRNAESCLPPHLGWLRQVCCMYVCVICVYVHIGASACVVVLYECVYAHIGASAHVFVFMCMYACSYWCKCMHRCLLECGDQKIALVLFLGHQPPFSSPEMESFIGLRFALVATLARLRIHPPLSPRC